MDAKDFRILAELRENARQSLQSLGRKVSLSAPAVRERLRRLEARGTLQGYWVSIDPAVFGRENLLVYFEPDWSRDEALKALEVEGAAWVAWKVDGGLTVQLWPKKAAPALEDLSRHLGRAPAWQGLSQSGWDGKLTRTDLRLIDTLVDEPLASVLELAARLRLSPKTVRGRVAALVKSEAIYVVARLGQGKDPGDLVYDLLVSGTAAFSELRRIIGDAALIHEVSDPRRLYLFCRSQSLADLTAATHKVSNLPGVTHVQVSLNRELIVAREFHHALVRDKLEAIASAGTRSAR